MSLFEAGDGVMRYRGQAAHFLELAEAAPAGRARTRLLYLAGHFERLASNLKAESDARSALLLRSSPSLDEAVSLPN